MKIRSGYVSNSSSSSFMIFGKYIDEVPENLHDLRNKGVRCYEADEDGPCIGIDFDIEEDETWGQYKQRAAKLLTELGIPSDAKDMRLCSGTYYC